MKIERLKLENYKLFDALDVEFSKITLLTGANSSGKSVVLSCLAAILQSREDLAFPFCFQSYGEFVHLGGFRDIVKHANTRKKFSVTLDVSGDNGHKVSLTGKYRYSSDGNQILLDEARVESMWGNLLLNWNSKEKKYRVKQENTKTSIDKTKIFSTIFKSLIEASAKLENEAGISKESAEKDAKKFIDRMSSSENDWETLKEKTQEEIKSKLSSDPLYQRSFTASSSAIRQLRNAAQYIGPIRAYPARQYPLQSTIKRVDSKGEASYFLILEWYKNNPKNFLKLQSDLSYLGLAHSVTPRPLRDDLIELQVTPHGHSEYVNLTDVGFGISQILPVLVANILVPSGGVMLVNQPEVHLHPSAQARLANYFSRESKKKNFIIETHSEYLINRFRLLISQKKLRSDEIKIIYFDPALNSTLNSSFCEISINENGQLLGAPDSFFDTYFVDSKDLVIGAMQ